MQSSQKLKNKYACKKDVIEGFSSGFTALTKNEQKVQQRA